MCAYIHVIGLASYIIIYNLYSSFTIQHELHVESQIVFGLFISPAAHENCLNFGDFAVRETRQITFTLTNHGSQPVKFQWPSNLPCLSFSPTTGHLHPSSSKDVSVSFKSDRPVTLNQQRVPGKIWKIKFTEPLKKVTCILENQ